MDSSLSNTVRAEGAEVGKPRPRRRLRSVRVFARALGLGGLAWALWYNQHRNLSWRQTLNPAYWVARYQGDDLYLPDKALLLHGNRRLPEVALTFDDGPHMESRAQILDTLKRYGAKATFFDVGARMAEHPDLLQRTLAEGHEIANHSSTHQRLDALSDRDRHREINDADITFFRLTGKHLNLLRPPGERYNDTVLKDTRDAGYIVVLSNTAARDFDTDVTPAFIAERTCSRADNGSLILLHDYPNTAAALPQILDTLRSRGFRFVTVSEMIAHLPPHPRQAALAFSHP